MFIATGAMVFNGAQMGRASSVALGGAVHIWLVVPPEETRIPIGWVAVGDPARLYPPGEAAQIRAGLEEGQAGSSRSCSEPTRQRTGGSRCAPRCGATPGPWPAAIMTTSSSPDISRKALQAVAETYSK